MARIRILNHSAKEIVYKNNMQRSESFELTNRCRFNMGFTNGTLCRGEMTMGSPWSGSAVLAS